MNFKTLSAIFFTFAFSLSAYSQKAKIGDYIESYSTNLPTGMKPRTLQYKPDGGDFVSVNGTNRYTRALYGSHSDYRVETSDMPIFALFKGKNYRNLRFSLSGVPLDSVSYCEARYGKGRRTYVLKDDRWGTEATATLEVLARHDREGCYFILHTDGFSSATTLSYRLCKTTASRLSRNGDIGVDKKDCFEPSPTEEGLQTGSVTFAKTACIVTEPYTSSSPLQKTGSGNKDLSGHWVTLYDLDNCAKEITDGYRASCNYFDALSQRVSFITPDPWLNTLGATLSLAADGVWDGETWLHGAIGWRMPLAGWRAGYLGDVLGWNDRAVSHFNAYANSQVTNVEPTIPSPSQDPSQNLARAEKKWGTQMYSNGYICRNPNRNDQMHHYDMNLNYMDELLWHFQYDADTAYMRKMWPVITRHLAWEKRNFDKDNNHLYDAYCCIWASDALYYNGGEVTHSTAYNYRGNLLAAKIARLINEDPQPYQAEADAILRAMNEKLWSSENHWAEYRDVMGLKRLHTDAAVWSIYTPIDCGVGTPEQMYSSTLYVDNNIPHINVEAEQPTSQPSSIENWGGAVGQIISTSDWMPYSWSINNVAPAEIMHTALAYFEAGRANAGMQLLKSNIMDQMYLGSSPGNLGQISYYDAARGECYRDFGDNVGISARAIVQGLFGIVPHALDSVCIIRPGFPLEWDSVQVTLPYLRYKYKRNGNTGTLTIAQNFTRPLRIITRINGERGSYTDYQGTTDSLQTITFTIPSSPASSLATVSGQAPATSLAPVPCGSLLSKASQVPSALQGNMSSAPQGKVRKVKRTTLVPVPFNASVTDIFKEQYVSPRPNSTSLEMPIQGIGEWCHPKFNVEINDSVFRSLSVKGKRNILGIDYLTPSQGNNILFCSLWDNYPDSASISIRPVKAHTASILLAGSTNHMQTRIANAVIYADYEDGTCDSLLLIPPFNYCPIEQDYFVDGKAFNLASCATNPSQHPTRPVRVSLSSGIVSSCIGDAMGVPATEVYGRLLDGGAAQIISMPLDKKKKVTNLTLRCLSNDIVVGIMAVTLLR